MATTESTAEATEVPADKTNEYLEYLGEEPHGTAFLTSHTLPKNDPVWGRLRVDKPSKDLVWNRDEFGPPIGNRGNRMLLSTEGMSPELVTAVAKIPGFKVVNE